MNLIKKFSYSFFIMFLTASSYLLSQDNIKAAGQPHYEPVNKNEMPEAKKLLNYLYSISGKYTIAGQHNYSGNADFFLDTVKALTGKLPEIWGSDFINYYRNNEGEKIVQEAYKKFKQGYIITLMWHTGRPQDDAPFGWKESVQNKMTDSEWSELITAGTKLNNRFTARMDTIAHFLDELQRLGVPVLWRPFHESNGVWFWWGNRKGDKGSAMLYKMMFERFVNYHHLNNLIWVWDANGPRDLPEDEAYAYKDFFPGLNYVDVLATDIYHFDYEQNEYQQLVDLGEGKPVALGEVGEVPTPLILKYQPKWTWFMVWANFIYSNNTKQQVQNLYDDDRVLTHEDFIGKK